MEKQIARIIYRMAGLIAVILALSAWQWEFIHEGIAAHFYMTMSILGAFAFAVVMAFIFVFKLKNEVVAFNALKEMWDDIRIGPSEELKDPLWRHFRCSRPGRIFKRPRLLGHAYDLVTEELARTKRIRVSVETMNTLVHKIGQTIDDEKSLLGYMSGLLVFMGLIGTFIGLLHMVGSMGNIIGTLAQSAGGAAGPDAFQQLLGALQEPLKGMASGFASSLFGLFSSLVVGLLGRMAGQAAGVLKHEFEAWLAGVVQIGDEEYSGKDGGGMPQLSSAGSTDQRSLVHLVAGILSDYSKVSGSFDRATGLLHQIQEGQERQNGVLERMMASLAVQHAATVQVQNELAATKPLAGVIQGLATGLEAFTSQMTQSVVTELQATRALVEKMDRSHSGNLRTLANNHAQTAVQVASAIEQLSGGKHATDDGKKFADLEQNLGGTVQIGLRHLESSVHAKLEQLDRTVLALAERDAWHGHPAAVAGAPSEQAASDARIESTMQSGFENLHETIRTAFSAYSSVLRLAVAALEKSSAAASPAGPASETHNRPLARERA